MKKILLVLMVCLAATAQADDRGYIRNDSAATLQGTNLETSAASVTAAGAVQMNLSTAFQSSTSPIQAEDVSVSEGGPVMLMGSRRINSPGTNNPGTDGDIGFVNQSGYGGTWSTLVTSLYGGDTYSLQNALSTTVKAVKASIGTLTGYHCYNPAAAVTYIQIFNTASGSVTLGTTTPVLSLGIPAGGGGNVTWPTGIAFSTAISVAATTTATGSSAPATAADCNFIYK